MSIIKSENWLKYIKLNIKNENIQYYIKKKLIFYFIFYWKSTGH